MARENIHKLDMLKAHKLITLMLDPENGWTAKRMTLNAYTDFACRVLDFPVTAIHIQTRIKEFGIPRGDAPQPAGDMAALASAVLQQGMDIADLKERIARLEGWVNSTFPSKSPLKVVG